MHSARIQKVTATLVCSFAIRPHINARLSWKGLECTARGFRRSSSILLKASGVLEVGTWHFRRCALVLETIHTLYNS
jgi:hypothetical protein